MKESTLILPYLDVEGKKEVTIEEELFSRLLPLVYKNPSQTVDHRIWKEFCRGLKSFLRERRRSKMMCLRELRERKVD